MRPQDLRQPPDHVPNLQFERLGGMDYDTRPHLLKMQQWRLLYNATTRYGGVVEQVPPKKSLFTAGVSFDTIVNVPTLDANYGAWVGIADTGIYKITASGVSLIAAHNSGGSKFSTFVYNGYLFYTNSVNPVQYTD